MHITLNVHKDLQWIDKQDISKVDWAPADIEVLDKWKCRKLCVNS